ncbi:peroxidase-like [Paramacrobiotus metropolitanus]|uniref:peroxidase-like n=1 Tax=Paramacrobiotus metropolitanus TaxID=2943436 RepID=UPI0024465B74|nr:peroxidase-like [Paramacrobiotus metropolitanus]
MCTYTSTTMKTWNRNILLSLIAFAYFVRGKTVLWEDRESSEFFNLTHSKLVSDNEIPFKWTPIKFPGELFPFDMNNPLDSVTFPSLFPPAKSIPLPPQPDTKTNSPPNIRTFPVDQFPPIDLPKGVPPLIPIDAFNFTFPSSIYNVQIPKFMSVPTANLLTDLSDKFPQLSKDLINNLYSSASKNVSKQYTFSRGSRRPNSPLPANAPPVPVPANTPSVTIATLTTASPTTLPRIPFVTPLVSGVAPTSTASIPKPVPGLSSTTSTSISPPFILTTPRTNPTTSATVTSFVTPVTSLLPNTVQPTTFNSFPVNPLTPAPAQTPITPARTPATTAVPPVTPNTTPVTTVTPVSRVTPAEKATTPAAAGSPTSGPSTTPSSVFAVTLTSLTTSTSFSTPLTSTISAAQITSTPANFTTVSPLDSQTTTHTPMSLSGIFGSSNPENTKTAEQAATVELVSKSVSEMLNLNKTEITDVLSGVVLPQIKDNCSQNAEFPQVSLSSPFTSSELVRSECFRNNANTSSTPLKYRTITGRCNNVAFPDRGKESTVFVRLLDPDYADGVSEPRKSQSKIALPSARLISSSLVGTQVRLAPTWTTMFMQFGQFLDHDLTHTPQTQVQGNCCLPPSGSSPGSTSIANVTLAQTQVNLQCLPIDIPTNDPFYSRFGQRCMEFVRSLPGSRAGCTLGSRDQLNQASSYIDGNQIYGSTLEQANKLRLFQNGFLKSSEPFPSNRRYSLLPSDGRNQTCQDASLNRPCFDAGDIRVNVQIGLQAVQTMFMRHHNLLCQRLQTLNPQWNDEKLYQEARAIVAAQLQHITYNEWLPVLVGDSIRVSNSNTHTGLALLNTGRFTGYNITLNPAMSNEFATAAFRVGHSMVTGNFRRLRANFESSGNETVRDTFFQSSRMYGENVADELIIGMVQDAGKIINNNVVADLSQLLFRSPSATFGMDLVSLNLQRGRDHGLPGYMQFRRLCGLPVANSFQELRSNNNITGILPDDVVVRLASVYQSVDDIDLYVAGISENRINGGIIGPTFACIISEQFSRLRRADRFWYENGLPIPSTFSDAQLAEIRGTTLAKLLCDVSTIMVQSQPRVFETVSTINPIQSCQQFRQFDLSAWKESPL